jgi:hypothetical protein
LCAAIALGFLANMMFVVVSRGAGDDARRDSGSRASRDAGMAVSNQP